MKKTIIGISSGIMRNENGNFAGYQKNYVNKDYIDSIIENGGIPMVIPFHKDKEMIAEQVSLVDGILFAGGHDVHPLHYGEEPDVKCQETFPERDLYEFELLKCAIEQQKPVLGICRGIQMINTYFGGTLYQDNSYIDNIPCRHDQQTKPSLGTHTVQIEKDSRLYKIMGADEIIVNSFHHQSVKIVGKGLKVTARAKDGIVEAVERETESFLVAVQWHPEMMHQNCKSAKQLFTAFIQSAAVRR